MSDLHARVHEALAAAGFTDDERAKVLVLQERISDDRWDVECESLTDLITKAKGHYKKHGGLVESKDDPKRLQIGYAIGQYRWYMRLSKVKEARDVDAIYQDFLRTQAGRQRLAQLIMTAAKSEPPPAPPVEDTSTYRDTK